MVPSGRFGLPTFAFEARISCPLSYEGILSYGIVIRAYEPCLPLRQDAVSVHWYDSHLSTFIWSLCRESDPEPLPSQGNVLPLNFRELAGPSRVEREFMESESIFLPLKDRPIYGTPWKSRTSLKGGISSLLNNRLAIWGKDRYQSYVSDPRSYVPSEDIRSDPR